MLPRTSTRFYRANQIFAAYVNTFLLQKIAIPFPISQRIEKKILFVNKQSKGKLKKSFLHDTNLPLSSELGLKD